jgi:hypothetical protein
MGDRATRPLNSQAVSAADDELYGNHEGDPRPNALFDAEGNRKPLDANDPSQADLRSEWMDSYKAHGGQTEPIPSSSGTPGQAVVGCDERPVVNPVIVAVPEQLDESPDNIDELAQAEPAQDGEQVASSDEGSEASPDGGGEGGEVA